MSEPYLAFEVAWPENKLGRVQATGKGRPRFSRKGGHAYTPAKTRKFEAAIKAAAIKAMGDRPPLDEAIGLRVLAYMPVPESWSNKKREAAWSGDIAPTGVLDYDNIAKLCDGINPKRGEPPIVWRDDALVVSAQIMKLYSATPRLRFEIYRWF